MNVKAPLENVRKHEYKSLLENLMLQYICNVRIYF
jgi:hypothetical protein